MECNLLSDDTGSDLSGPEIVQVLNVLPSTTECVEKIEMKKTFNIDIEDGQ